MKDPISYWSPLIELRNRLGCWVRIAWTDGVSIEESDWTQMLLMPVAGYLEVSGGPLREVEWVDVSTRVAELYGGTPPRPPRFVDVREELVAGLRGTQLHWELRETTWSMERVFRSLDRGFKDEPVVLLRVTNPFRTFH